jgi:hypothetical protein
MARVYISSTYEDMKAHREVISALVRQLKHEPIGMEDYVAEGSLPLDKCLRDVASCDAYVGIIGWRYGYIPDDGNAERLSITELEYRKAKALGKQVFIFLQSKSNVDIDAADRFTGKGDSGKLIDRFRDELGTKNLVQWFDQLQDLKANAGPALAPLAQMGNMVALKELKGLGILILKLYTYQSVHDRLDQLWKATPVLRSERPEALTKQVLDRAGLDGKEIAGNIHRSLHECNRFLSEDERRNHVERKLALDEGLRKLAELAANPAEPDVPTLAREVRLFNHNIMAWRANLNQEAEDLWREIRLGELSVVLDRLRPQIPGSYYDRVERGVRELNGEPPLYSKCNVLTTERNVLRELLSLFASLWTELEQLDIEDLRARCRAIQRRVKLAKDQWTTYVGLQGCKEDWETLLLGDGQDHWEDIARHEKDLAARLEELDGPDTATAQHRLAETLRKAQKRLEAHFDAVDEALGKAFGKVNIEVGKPLIEAPVAEETHA